MRRPKSWLAWLGVLMGCAALSLGLVALGAWAIMGRVCTDAKPAAGRNSSELPFFRDLPRVLNIAHRGASKLAPEHSLRAYELALEQGAQVLELDVRLTRDRVLLVAHDRTLERTIGVDAAFSDLPFSELERLAGARTPLRLEQVLRRFAATRFNVELKDEDLEAARALADVIGDAQAAGRVLVASTHQAVLSELRTVTRGSVATSASAREALAYYFCDLMNRPCKVPYSALQLPAVGWLGLTSPGFLARAHARGLAVHFWTVDDAARMEELIAAGADGIMTNRPDVLASVLKARQ